MLQLIIIKLHFMKHLITILCVLAAFSSLGAQDTIRVYPKYLGTPLNGGVLADTNWTKNLITNEINGIVHPSTDLGLNGNTITSSTGVGVDISSLLNTNIWSLNGTKAYYNGGNVGIGTTAPSAKFHIVNDDTLSSTVNTWSEIMVRESDVGNAIKIWDWVLRNEAGSNWLSTDVVNGIAVDGSFNSPTSAKAFWRRDIHAGSHFFGNAGTSHFSVLGGGNVGIGTTAPDSKLEVDASSNAFDGLKIRNWNTGDQNRAGLTFEAYAATTAMFQAGHNYTGVSAWQDKFVIGTNADVSNGMIFRAASGGIQFSIAGTNDEDFMISDSEYLRSQWYGLGNISTTGTSRAAAYDVSGKFIDDTNVYFKSGDVGIGTTAPTEKLEVSGDLSVRDPSFGTQGDGTSDYGDVYSRVLFKSSDGFNLMDNDANAWIQSVHLRPGANHTAPDAGLQFITSSPADYRGSVKMTIENYGKVGIGTTVPTEKLDVNGKVKAIEFIGNIDWSHIQNAPTIEDERGGFGVQMSAKGIDVSNGGSAELDIGWLNNGLTPQKAILNCTTGVGTVTLTVKVNGVNILNKASAGDGEHAITGASAISSGDKGIVEWSALSGTMTGCSVFIATES